MFDLEWNWRPRFESTAGAFCWGVLVGALLTGAVWAVWS